MRRRVLILSVFTALVLGPNPALIAQDRGMAVMSFGLFDITDHTDILEFGLEWRGRPKAWKLQFNVGAMVNAFSGSNVFVGARRDFRAAERWGVSVGFAGGLYEKKDGPDLGGAFEFRTSFELHRKLSALERVGIGIYHLSHANLNGTRNPGADSIVLFYGLRPR